MLLSILSPASIAQTIESPLDVPQLTGITIDGKPDDWADHGFLVDALAPADGNLPAHVADIRFRTAWDARGFLFLMTVRNSAPDQQRSVELLLGRSDTIDRIRLTVAGDAAAMHASVIDNRQMMEARQKPIETTVQTTTSANGYTVEALLPWKNLDLQPAAGLELRIQVRVNETDADGQKSQYRWHPGSTSYIYSMLYIRLAAAPSAPIELAAAGRYERLQRIRVGLVGSNDLAGRPIDLVDGDRVLTSGKFAASGTCASAALVIPMPPRGHPYGQLSVRAGDQARAKLDLPDADSVRAQALLDLPIIFKPFVFSGKSFPDCDFQDPALADELFGPYTLHTTFYDANMNAVKQPTAAGRYGAVVEIRSEESGKSFKRSCTLFKTPGEVDWTQVKLSPALQLPEGLGLSPSVIGHQSREVHFQMANALNNSLSRDPATAIAVAGLYETSPDAPAWLERENAAERDRQWWYRLHRKIGDFVPLKYLAYTPKDYDRDPSRRWPLILFLHGAGERGDDLEKLKTWGIPLLCEQGKDDSYIALCPLCPANESWLAMSLNDLLDGISKKYRIDPDRVYVTGASMGGVATWSLTQQYPDRFAAIAPACGHGDPEDVERIKNLPVWIFHGEKDPVVPFFKAKAMVAALMKIGGRVKITSYPDVGHECWNATYATPDLIPWLLAQKRGNQ